MSRRALRGGSCAAKGPHVHVVVAAAGLDRPSLTPNKTDIRLDGCERSGERSHRPRRPHRKSVPSESHVTGSRGQNERSIADPLGLVRSALPPSLRSLFVTCLPISKYNCASSKQWRSEGRPIRRTDGLLRSTNLKGNTFWQR